VVWGVGQALTEETLVDPRSGRYVNADLAEYHVPVNADIGTIDVNFVESAGRARESRSALKGAGRSELPEWGGDRERVYNATGVRVRRLPITLDKMLSGSRA